MLNCVLRANNAPGRGFLGSSGHAQYTAIVSIYNPQDFVLRLPFLRATQPAAREFLVVNEVLNLLKDYPFVRYQRGEDSVRVPAATPEGFDVIIEQIWEGHYAVSYGGWQKDFDLLEEAAACFLVGLSILCRMKVETKDKKPVRWTVEHWEDPNWREVSSKGAWSPWIFKPAVISYLQNDLLPENEVQARIEKLVAPSGLPS